jgi:hypothetical protein
MAMRRPRLVRLVVLAMLGGFAPPAAAQSSLPITVDQRVRLWTDAAGAVTGRVTAVTPATVQVEAAGLDPVTIATATVRRVEISRSRSSRGAGFRRGALRGAIIMGVLGAISLGLQHDSVGEDGATATEAVLLGAWSGGLFGGLIGGGIGAARAGDRWEQVWP